MKESSISTAHNSLLEADLEDMNSSSYASGTGLLFVVVIIALFATGFSLVSLAQQGRPHGFDELGAQPQYPAPESPRRPWRAAEQRRVKVALASDGEAVCT